MDPSVSVIIPTYNAPQYLNRALESVATQTRDGVEVIVVDDGSEEACVSQYRLPEGTRLLRLPHSHGGAAVPRNVGLRAARGRYLALLDHDDVWCPTKLARQVQTLHDHPECAVTYCHVTRVDEHLQAQPRQGTFRAPGADPLGQVLFHRLRLLPSALLFRREALEVCGWFDEDIGCVSDWDFALRLANAVSLHGDATPLVLRGEHGHQMSHGRLAVRRSEVAVMRKTMGWLSQQRPDLLPLARRRFGRALRQLAEEVMADPGEVRQALHLNREARGVWPWHARSYGQLIRLLPARLRPTAAGRDSGSDLCR